MPSTEIDLLLLKEITMHSNVETNRTAMVAQTISLTIVGLFFSAAFFYALTHPDPPSAGASTQPFHTEIGS